MDKLIEYSWEDLAERLALSSKAVAVSILGSKYVQTGATLRYGSKGALAVNITGPRRGTFKDFSDATAYGDLINLYCYVNGVDPKEGYKWALRYLGLAGASNDTPTSNADTVPPVSRTDDTSAEDAKAEEEERRKWAAQIFDRADDFIDTAGSRYLASRAISPDFLAQRTGRSVIRWQRLHLKVQQLFGLIDQDAQKADPRFSSLIFLATDGLGTARCIQQILLDDDRKASVKVPKRSLGPLTGAGVRLGEPGPDVILAEGPETGCSAFEATGVFTVVTLGASNLFNVELPDCAKRIWIAVDREVSNDGIRAALHAAGEWRSRGRDVFLVWPSDPGTDLNDIHRKYGTDAIRELFRRPITSVPLDQMPPAPHPTVITHDVSEGLAAWRATGFPTRSLNQPIDGTTAPARISSQLFDVQKPIVVLRPGIAAEAVGLYHDPDRNSAFVLRTELPLDQIYTTSGPDHLKHVLRCATPISAPYYIGVEKLFPAQLRPVAVFSTGVPPSTNSGAAVSLSLSYDKSIEAPTRPEWRFFAGRRVAFELPPVLSTPAACAEVKRDALSAGVADVRLFPAGSAPDDLFAWLNG